MAELCDCEGGVAIYCDICFEHWKQDEAMTAATMVRDWTERRRLLHGLSPECLRVLSDCAEGLEVVSG